METFARNPITTGNPPEYNVSQTARLKGLAIRINAFTALQTTVPCAAIPTSHNPPSYDEFWVKKQTK